MLLERKIFKSVKDCTTGRWRRIKNTDLKTLFQSKIVIDVIKITTMDGACLSQNIIVKAMMENEHWENLKQD